tara:strand:+ start:53 stop:772 length:720 start_codon:yes stop_codon:yes gene_type:complete
MAVDKRYLTRNLLGDNETSLGLRTNRPYTSDGGAEKSWLGSWTDLIGSLWDDLTGNDKKAMKETVQKYLDKQNAEGAEENKGILSKWEREGEWQDNDYYSGLLDSERPIVTEDDSEHELDFISDESYNKQWDADNQDPIRQNEREMSAGWDSENQDPIRQNERELSAPSAPAKSSPASKMSPQAKSAMVGLLKEFLTPAPDDAPPQVRGAGIIRGGGTPFPSLLQKKPERAYYQNKGLV